MKVLYQISIFLLGAGMKVLSFFDPKAKEFVAGRTGIFLHIHDALKGNRDPVLWVHCASLGEFEQGRPVMEALKSNFPNHKIFLTFFSPSGYKVRKGYSGADYVFYLPLDTHSNARRFVDLVRPVMAIFVKYEFWYFYSHELKKRSIPLISVSAIFRPDQYFFRKTGSFSRRILKNVSHFFVQNQVSVDLLHSINLYNCTISGDTRFDRVKQVEQHWEEVPIAKKFKSDEKTLVAGSCWQEDLDVIVPFANENTLKFIIAPHEIDEALLRNLEISLSVRWIRYSQAEGKDLEDYAVLIIDNVGLLSRLYRYGEFAYLGGAFGKGLHNILEAATYGVPVLFGNKSYSKFQEANDIINRGGAFPVSDYTELKKTYEMLNVPESYLLACEVCRQYVNDNTGATEKIMRYCDQILRA